MYKSRALNTEPVIHIGKARDKIHNHNNNRKGRKKSLGFHQLPRLTKKRAMLLVKYSVFVNT